MKTPLVKPNWLKGGERHENFWGFRDTFFSVTPNHHVILNGDRYSISNVEMPHLLPFIQRELGLHIDGQTVPNKIVSRTAPPSRISAGCLGALQQTFGSAFFSLTDADRATHSRGCTMVSEVCRYLFTQDPFTLPDAVVFPRSDEEVEALIAFARAHQICLIPYGGGTNVSNALRIPASEQRLVFVVNMRRMNKIRKLDTVNHFADVEAGMTGAELESALREHGFTCGHEPDSIELSTLGGWVATNASGMKKNRYGNIEQIVLSVDYFTALGKVSSSLNPGTPRQSVSLDPKSLLFGSEGNLGIITACRIKIHPLPACQQYGSLIFPSFAQGLQFLRALHKKPHLLPASVRLVNNNEFRFGQALKPRESWPNTWIKQAQKWALQHFYRLDFSNIAAVVYIYEGEAAEVRRHNHALCQLAKQFGGISGGAANGKKSYELTFAIGYISTLGFQYGILSETFETSVAWDKIESLCAGVEEALQAFCASEQIDRTYLSYRVTQLYETGVCVYFSCAIKAPDMAHAIPQFERLERAMRTRILQEGGSLSHHHGVGKLRQPFLAQAYSSTALALLQRYKAAIDPDDIFAIRNGIFSSPNAHNVDP